LADNPVITVIRGKEISDGFKGYFDFLWKSARRK